ncbi:MAG: hypothetical protein H8F28_11010 [Fibrella sp.]|nr:hypothetical protein [Armatimonadota bacterium]
MTLLAPLIATLLMLAGTIDSPMKIELTRAGSGYTLLRAGKPYFIKGAGAESRLDELKKLGANSVRTWGVDDKTGAFLDRCHAQGLTVTIGYWMRKNDGFSYKNAAMRDEQAEDFRKRVRQYRNHPALLMWSVGNEVELGTESPEVYLQIERLAKIVKEEDPNHPVMTVLADMWPEKMAILLAKCPSLDLLGINSYDGLPTLHERMRLWTKPYVITEYAFSLPSTVPGAPWVGAVEPSSAEKASSTTSLYQNSIVKQKGRVLGGYLFYWGASKVGTAAFHTTHLSTGERLAVVDAMQQLWSGKAPQKRVPILSVSSPAKPARLSPSAALRIAAKATDYAGATLPIRFEVLPNDPTKRFVGDFEQKAGVLGSGSFQEDGSVTVPKEPGKYRILLTTRDKNNGAATHSISFVVDNK